MASQNEIRFGKRLAANDKTVRDKAVRKLKVWLQSHSGLSELDNCKLWRGLFYCMWMSDKPLVQEELADEIARLMHCFPDSGASLAFVRAFFVIMGKDWANIDRLRIDKFYMLVRKCLREMFELLRRNDWDRTCVESLASIFQGVPLASNSKYPNGLKWFLVEKYLDELKTVLETDKTVQVVDQAIMELLLRPHIELLAWDKEKVFRQKVIDHIFLPLTSNADQSLQIDLVRLADICFSLAADTNVDQANRSMLYGIRKAAQDAQRAYKNGQDHDELEGNDKGSRKRDFEEHAPLEAKRRPNAKKVKRISEDITPVVKKKQFVVKDAEPDILQTPEQRIKKRAAVTEQKRADKQGAVPIMAPSSEPQQKRRVQIVLAKNKVNEFNKFHRVARPDSPRAFDPTRRPVNGVLKKSDVEPSNKRSRSNRHPGTPLQAR